MAAQSNKCVMVIDENLPMGIISNTAAILGISIGKELPETVGADVTDKTGKNHLGIVEWPVPILKGGPDLIKELRKKLYEPEFSDMTVVDFSDVAQSCKTYDDFIGKISDTPESNCDISG